MKVLLSWLNELAPVGHDADSLADRLSALGMAVDATEHLGAPVAGVITAKVLSLRPHPQADRIQLVDVDTGDGEPLQICCGAFNMAVGDVVPLATLGTVMPNGLEIQRRKLRGEWSNGMLCSAAELNLGADHGGIFLLRPDLPLGAPAFEAMGITSDVVFDLDLTRNRPDAWCHLGVARDLAAHLGVPLSVPGGDAPVPAGDLVPVTVELVDPAGCPRFTATVLTGVVVGPSPAWMQERLTRAGMRPINNVVDVSNHVMLELGQPNHPYDLHTLEGHGFRVRRAVEGEVLVTLDDVERRLGADDLLICDATDRPIGLAGIMGGANTEISDATTTVVLEAASFEPLGIAHTAGRLGLRSEASARFERGVDPWIIDRAVNRFVELLRLTCPDLQVAPGAVDANVLGAARPVVRLRTARVTSLLGQPFTVEQVAGLLEPIGFSCSPAGADLDVTIPSWRPDCEAEIDLVEEVARHFGYDRLGKLVPPSAHPGRLAGHQLDRRLIRQVLLGLGCSEVMPSPLVSPDDLDAVGLDGAAAIALSNPMVREESVLRTSLLPGLVRAVAANEARQAQGVSLFEIGHVYLRGEGRLPDERERVAVALAGREAPAAVEAWVELAAALDVTDWSVVGARPAGLHPTRAAEVRRADGSVLALVGEIDPDVLRRNGVTQRVAYVEVELDPVYARERVDRRYRPVSRFPASEIDLAFVLPDDVPAAALTAALRDGAGDLLVDLRLFDTYRGAGVPDGARSLAYRLRLQSLDRTLTDAEVAAVRTAAVGEAAGVGAALRG